MVYCLITFSLSHEERYCNIIFIREGDNKFVSHIEIVIRHHFNIVLSIFPMIQVPVIITFCHAVLAKKVENCFCGVMAAEQSGAAA